MTTQELETDLLASQTDLSRYVEAALRTDRPYLVVASASVRAWERREPETWAKVSDWLAARGKTLVEI